MAIKALVDLIYWRNVKRTGILFTGLVVGLACLFQLSAVTVVSYLCLGIICITFQLRLYYKLLEVLHWNPDCVHPFQSYLDEDRTLTDGQTVKLVEEIVLLIAFAFTELKNLLFISSMIDSIKLWPCLQDKFLPRETKKENLDLDFESYFKFAGLLYLLTYVGTETNGLTLLIIGAISAFSMPILYKKQGVRIRRMVRAVKAVVKTITDMFDGLLSMVKPAADSDSEPTPAISAAIKQKAKSK